MTTHTRFINSKRALIMLAFLSVLLVIGVWSTQRGFASTPGAGTVSPGSPATWSGVTFGASVDHTTCVYGANCDSYKLTVNNPGGYNLKTRIEWALPVNDLDLYVCQGTDAQPCQTQVGNSGQSTTTFEEVTLANPASGVYYIIIVNFAGSTTHTGTSTLIQPPPPPPSPTPLPPGFVAPRYQNFAAPGGLGTNAGEPSIGVNWNTGKVMFSAGLQTLRVSFNVPCRPALWEDVSADTSATSLDPILFTDHTTGRTFVSQEAGPTHLASYTDDDGATYTPIGNAGIPQGIDHQTIGGGPYAPPLTGGALYQHAFYYCSQGDATAFCARSDDGGLTFGAGVPIYTALDGCGGIHGHVKVGADGTVYVPNKNCGGSPAVSVSSDNGVTWTLRRITGATASSNLVDPSIGISTNGTVYMGYQDSLGRGRIAVSHDRGASWTNDQDVGSQLGIQTITFPAVAAGDDDRASFAFLGTATGGDYQDYVNFRGVWDLYVATTYDGGQTWVTVDATPNDPVQRGSICNSGTVTCDPATHGGRQDRNLLDFMDATIDLQGRVLVGYPDGCIGGCVSDFPNSFTALASIVRQSGGKGLFAAFDPPAGQIVPAAPLGLSATKQSNSPSVRLSWSTPDNGGSAITGYRIYRGTNAGAETLLATMSGTGTSYTDSTAAAGVTYYYQVSAVNAIGEGSRSCEVIPVLTVVQNPCVLPGAQVANDTSDNAPNIPPSPSLDVHELYVAEPYFQDGSSKLVFTMKTAGGAPLANSQWYIIWNRTTPDANADRNYVAMKSDTLGALTFEYGTVSPPNLNVATAVGAADAGSYNPATGVIQITVANSKVDGVHAGQSLTGIQARNFVGRPTGPITQTSTSDYSPEGTYTLIGNSSCRPLQPDLTITNIVASQSRPNQTLLTVTVSNIGGADATGVVVRLRDGSTLIGNTGAIALARGTTANVSLTWDTRALNGDHIIVATADPSNTVAESNENNNQAQRTITIRGNKVTNGSFEQSSSSSPTGWSGSQGTSYSTNGANSSNGTKAVSATGNGSPANVFNPSWSSDAINVTAGQTYNLAMTVKTEGVSSSPGLQVTYLNALGQVVSTATGIATNIVGTTGFQEVLGQITVPQGVTQVRLKLVGFSLADLATHGTVYFDDVTMW